MKHACLVMVFSSALLAQQKDPAAVAAGKRTYDQVCQSCHGGNATGGRGPALANGVFQRGSTDADIARNIRTGVAGTEMPPFAALSADQTRQLVAYIRSLSSASATSSAGNAGAGNAAAGEQLFFGKAACQSCHQVNARGGIVGPDLSNAGRLEASLIRQKIVDPSTNTAPNTRAPITSLLIKTKAGQELRGVRRSEDTYGLVMVDTNGRLLRLDKRNLASVALEPTSVMPRDFAQRLSDAEIQNLVGYLKTLNGRDLTRTIQADIPGGLTFERIRNAAAEPQNWLTYWGDYSGRHFSALKDISVANVRNLQARWSQQMAGDSVLESTPLVVDGIMYVSGQPNQVYALDARTGLTIWRYQRTPKAVKPAQNNRFNRGVAVLGNRVFFGTLDAALVALDARTGQPLWETTVADTMLGYSITVAPLALKDRIIVGIAGGEYGVRGFIDSYDPVTGQRQWRFNTVPVPGEPGSETWKGDSWKEGAAATWLTGSYDPDLDVLYWTAGNPGPDIDAEVRQGDNLYSSSVIALDPKTGQRKWHYQFTPGDSHDWDANQDVILVDRAYKGQHRKLMLQANRNGMFYALDRTNGRFLAGTAFVRQTWNTGFDENGRPKTAPGWASSSEGSVVYPSLGGGTNWQAPSYSPETGWVYLETQESGQRYVRDPAPFEPGTIYMGGSAVALAETTQASIKAIDPETGRIKWQYKISRGSLSSGVLATSGGLLFAASAEGNLIALNARTGAPLWRFQTGGAISSAPMSYAVDGRQFIAVTAASVLYSFALPE